MVSISPWRPSATSYSPPPPPPSRPQNFSIEQLNTSIYIIFKVWPTFSQTTTSNIYKLFSSNHLTNIYGNSHEFKKKSSEITVDLSLVAPPPVLVCCERGGSWHLVCGVMDDIKGLDNSLNCVSIVLPRSEPRRSNWKNHLISVPGISAVKEERRVVEGTMSEGQVQGWGAK